MNPLISNLCSHSATLSRWCILCTIFAAFTTIHAFLISSTCSSRAEHTSSTSARVGRFNIA